MATWAGIAQSVQRLATVWRIWGSNPGADEIFLISPDRPRGPTSLLYTWSRVSFLGQSGRGVALTTHPHPASRLEKE